MIRGSYGCGFVIVVLWALYLCHSVIRHMHLVLLITWYCILLFERLMLKIFQKILRKVCVLRLLVYLLVCVLRMYC